MAILSMRARKKMWEYGLAAGLGIGALVAQATLLHSFPYKDVCCNLPLTLVIIWGAVHGSPMPPITPDELRLSTFNQIFARQLASGSPAGFLMGMFMAALLNPLLPVFPIYLPIAGWFAGYFNLKNVNSRNAFAIVPLVFVTTLLAETVMAGQLALANHTLMNAIGLGQAGAATKSLEFEQLNHIALIEAFLNALVSPFVYFPMRSWYEFTNTIKLATRTEY